MAAVADLVARQVRDLARRAQVGDIDAWFTRVLGELLELIAAGFEVLRRLTAEFLGEHAALSGRTVEPALAEWSTDAVRESMRIMGPVGFKNSIDNGVDPEPARLVMADRMAASAQRHAMTGERGTVEATVEESAEIIGWRRVSDGDPCAWCAMLVGRGAVYKSKASATRVVGRAGTARGNQALGGAYHDGDQCTAVPLYEDEEEPGEVDDLYRQWLEATAGTSGAEALRAWRRYWDERNEQSPFAERLGNALIGDEARAAAPLSLLRPSEVRGRGNALRPDEAAELASYKGAGFSSINPWLRDGEDESRPDLDARVRQIDNALSRSPLADSIVVHRGIVDPSLVFGDASGVNLTGAQWRERAYVSTSTAEGPARLFALLGADGEAAVMRILVPQGVGAVELSNGDYESELLLERGLRMRVVADSGPGTRPRVLDVEVLP